MKKVKIYGAGSIGNHLAQASRRVGWDVAVVDPDAKALDRMKNEIYPARYGAWDSSIKLYKLGEEPRGGFDVIFLGTPPDVRMSLAVECLKENPKILQLEKPIFAPLVSNEKIKEMNLFLNEIKNSNTQVIVGHEYVLGEGIGMVEKFIGDKSLGEVESLEVVVRENWKGIFSAHPWLAGPHETYLCFWQKGGGACGEHSHAIHLWRHFSEFLGLGKVLEISAAMNIVKSDPIEYDAASFINIRTEKGFLGHVIQDVITDPPVVFMRIQRKNGFVEWSRHAGPVERIKFGKLINGKWEVSEEEIKLKRPDDFYHEIMHIAKLLNNPKEAAASPVSLRSGLDALKIITAAHNSRAKGSLFVKI